MHRNWQLLLSEGSQIRKPICLKMQICKERIGKNAILMHFHAIIPDKRSSGEHSNNKLYMIFRQCGTMGSYLLNFLSVV